MLADQFHTPGQRLRLQKLTGQYQERPSSPRTSRRPTDGQRAESKVAFNTGATRGQGRSHALGLTKQSADIIGLDVYEQTRHEALLPGQAIRAGHTRSSPFPNRGYEVRWTARWLVAPVWDPDGPPDSIQRDRRLRV